MAAVVADRIKETSTSTGTGDFTLAGAKVGFRAFSAKCSVGDTFNYVIEGIDAAGAPSGEWEVGVGTYSAANTLTRTKVFDSSNAGATVSFSAGTKNVMLTLPALMATAQRERLTANRTYYVSTTGNDANDGLSAGSPFLTIQRAVNVVEDTLDINGYIVTVQLADGTYNITTSVRIGPRVGRNSDYASTFVIQGNSTTPDNVVISQSGTNHNCLYAIRSSFTVKDLKMQHTGSSGSLVVAYLNSWVDINNVTFGVSPGNHILCGYTSTIRVLGNYRIIAGAQWHYNCQLNSVIECISKTITITNTPTFSGGFSYASLKSVVQAEGSTYSGSTAATTVSSYTAHGALTIRNGGANLPGNGTNNTYTGGGYY